MKKKILGLIALTALALPALAEGPAAPAVDKKVGHALLDAYTAFFHDMAVSGSGGYEKVHAAFGRFLSEANQARQKNQIDQVFFFRYKKLLAITGLTMIPSGEIFSDILDEELGRFVKDVLGEDLNVSNPKRSNIGLVATALSEEILNLHLYLDDIEAKDKLRRSFEGKFLDVTPAKK
jgi:hypothetical protein